MPFAISEIKKLAKASGFLEKNSEYQLGIACEASKEMLRTRAKLLLQEAGRGAVLTSKSCDGTPLVTTVHTRGKMSTGERVDAHGRAGREFLVSNQFFRSRRADGSWNTAVALSEPVVLAHGKSANAILEASRVGWKTLRQMGHAGPAVEHYCWDRAGITALERLTRQWHLDVPHTTIPADISEKTSRLLEFVLVTPCSLHDCQNGFRWGMLEQCSDRDLLRDVYVGIEPLRNSADIISSQMSLWVTSRLSLKADDRSEEWKTRQNKLWETLDVPFDVAHLLSHQLQLCFVDGRLECYENAEDGLEQDIVFEMCSARFHVEVSKVLGVEVAHYRHICQENARRLGDRPPRLCPYAPPGQEPLALLHQRLLPSHTGQIGLFSGSGDVEPSGRGCAGRADER